MSSSSLRKFLPALHSRSQQLLSTSTRPVRRALVQGRAAWLTQVPARARRALDLEGTVVSPLRVELGGGPFPTPGYVHVDHDSRSRHLEYRAAVWDLPFEEATVDEILAVHVLEHVHPARLADTLAEWHRVLRPGGTLQVHVPNSAAVFEAFHRASPATKWALMNPFFGYGSGPEVTTPDQVAHITTEPDHCVIYDFPLLESVLRNAKFMEVEDLTYVVTDRHTLAWAEIVDRMSLVVKARRVT